MPRVKIGLQIEETSPLVRHLIGSGKGVSEWDGVDPDEIVKVTYTVESSDIQEINPGIYYNIPSITTAKQGDTLFSDDGRLFVYDEVGSRWFLWYTFDNDTAKIHTNNTLKGEGTLDDPLSVNSTVVALKGDLNPLLEGTDNGDGTYTFTSVDGNTMFTVNVGDNFVTHIDELRLTEVPKDNTRIDVIGYYLDTPGKGGGRFYWDASSTEPDNGGTVIQITGQSTGRWKRFHDGNVDAYWFGLRGEGTGDETVRLQEFFDHIMSEDYSSATINGDYRISETVIIGGSANRVIHGTPSFRAIASMETMIRFNNAYRIYVTGVWHVTGTTTRVYTARIPYGEGVHIANSGRAHFEGFIGVGFRDSVVSVVNGNSTLCSIGKIVSTNVGTGAPGNSWTNSLTANWSNKVNTGNPASTGQRSTITVDRLPDSSRRGIQLCYISGEYYEIRSKNEIDSTISVYPFIPDSLTSGMLVYHYGAALYLSGSDTNVLEVGTIEATRTGTGIDMTSLYGPNVDRMLIQSCGTAFMVGREGNASMVSYNINQLYTEGNLSGFIYLVRAGYGNHNVNTLYEFSKNSIKFISRHNQWDKATSLMLNDGGQILTYEKPPRNGLGAGGSATVNLDKPNKVITLGRNSVNISLNPNRQLNRMFGYDTAWLVVRGNGPNGSPTGVISFQSQRSDSTYRDINGVNSSTPIEYQGSEFPGPALFVCYYRVGQDDFMVDPVSRIQTPSEIGALQPGDNISELVNDEGFVDAAGAASAAPVQSINGDTGAVSLDANDVGAIPASEKGANNGVATLDANGQLQTSQVPSYAITEIIEASETSIAAFAANSGSYDFDVGDVILIDNGGVISHYFYKGGTKTDVNEYSAISASQVDWGNVTNKPTFLYPGDNISELVNDEGYVDAAGAASAAPVQSVNSQSGAVVLDADDIDDSATVNKFVTQALINTLNSAVQPGDLATVATTGNYSDLTGAPAIPDSLDDLSGDSDDITEGTAHLFMTTAERNKLSGIDSGAEVNVNADWNAVSGDAQILNKPTLGTAAAADTGDFATAAQGALADTAVQPGDLAAVATTGAYSDLSGTPTLGTAAAADVGDFATSAQGSLADTAVQPNDLANVATSGDYNDLINTPPPIAPYNVFLQNSANEVENLGVTESTILNINSGSTTLSTADCAIGQSYELTIYGANKWNSTSSDSVTIRFYLNGQFISVNFTSTSVAYAPVVIRATVNFISGTDAARVVQVVGVVNRTTGNPITVMIPNSTMTVDVTSGATVDITSQNTGGSNSGFRADSIVFNKITFNS